MVSCLGALIAFNRVVIALQVSTEFLLMGLLSEEPPSKTGFYGSGITLDKARTAVEALQERARQADGRSSAGPTQELPFSRDAKRVFETAAEVAFLPDP